jgi:hypothetical protein
MGAMDVDEKTVEWGTEFLPIQTTKAEETGS